MSSRGVANRGIALLVAAAFATPGCVQHKWTTLPSVDDVTATDEFPGHQVRFTFPHGTITLTVLGVSYPSVEGGVEAAAGITVDVDLREVRKAERVELDDRGRVVRRVAVDVDDELLSGHLEGATVSLQTAEGPAMLTVESAAYPYVSGHPHPSPGRVSLDLTGVQKVEVMEVSGGDTVLASVGLVAAVFAALVVAVAVTKDVFCPLVYAGAPGAMGLAGEAFPGALLRSGERRDLLPLPLPEPRGTALAVSLRGTARQTQYLDEIALLDVRHPTTTRALASIDRRLLLVSRSRRPVSARDAYGRNVSQQVSALDGRVWQTDLGAPIETPPTLEEVVADFPAPEGGRPVLEIVGGNTEWLEVVLGRVLRAVGDRLPDLIAMAELPRGAEWVGQWRRREHLDLSVEVWDDTGWRLVGTVESPGAAALRHVGVPLPVQTDGSSVRIRLRAASGFWRIDQLALSTLETAQPLVDRLQPTGFVHPNAGDGRAAISRPDGRYLVMARPDTRLDLRFQLTPLSPGEARSLFLQTEGYYVPDERPGPADEALLAPLATEPGSLARLSHALARQRLEQWIARN